MKALKKAEQKQGSGLGQGSSGHAQRNGELVLEPLQGANPPTHATATSNNGILGTAPSQSAANLFQAKQQLTKPWLALTGVIGALLLVGWGIYFYLQISAPPPLTFPAHPGPATAAPTPIEPDAGLPVTLPPGNASTRDNQGEPEPVKSNAGPLLGNIEDKVKIHDKGPRQDAASQHEQESIKVTREKGSANINPDLASAYQALHEGRSDIAQSHYQRLLNAEPANIDALLGLAVISAKQGKIDQSSKYYMRVLELDPKNAPAQAGLIGFIGNADPATSESRLKQLVQNQPAPFLFFALGNFYAQQSQWPAAEQAYFQAFQMEPGNPDYAFNLAVSLEHLNQLKQALSFYQQALRLIQENSGANLNKAVLLSRIKQLSTPQRLEDTK